MYAIRSYYVAKNSVITLDYHVTNPDGEVVDEGRDPIVYLHGGYDDIFPKIEEAVITSYSIHYTKLYEQRQLQGPRTGSAAPR